jgi:hypothetical protein
MTHGICNRLLQDGWACPDSTSAFRDSYEVEKFEVTFYEVNSPVPLFYYRLPATVLRFFPC